MFIEVKSTGGTEAEAAAASASIGAVSGVDILRAIEKSAEVISPVTVNKATDAANIAAANTGANDLGVESAKKDAVIAAGISLRAMAKDGKFAAKQSEEKSVNAVNSMAASAVSKTLSTLVIAIRRTVDGGLKTINDALAAV